MCRCWRTKIAVIGSVAVDGQPRLVAERNDGAGRMSGAWHALGGDPALGVAQACGRTERRRFGQRAAPATKVATMQVACRSID